MISWELFIVLILAYLIGSIPNAVWIGKVFYKTDVRAHGSLNAGATNTLRILGKKAGISVFLLDCLKGWVAVKLCEYILNNLTNTSESLSALLVLSGMLATLGHIYPIFVGFKGGKGVATLLGVILALTFIQALITFAIFIIVLIICRYVSLSSILASISYAIMNVFLFEENPQIIKIFSVCIPILLIYTHRSNISKLLNGTENKINFNKTKKE
jgi:glycerol-3-phosphate acyltransferase PlsY